MTKTRKMMSETRMPQSPPQSWQRLLPLDHPATKQLRDRHVELAGIAHWDGPMQHNESSPSYHQMIYAVRGKAKLQIADQPTTQIKKGELWIFPARQSYRYWIENKGVFEFYWFNVSDSSLWQHLHLETAHKRYAGQSFRVPMLMQRLIDETNSTQPDATDAASLFAGLLATILERRLGSRYDAHATKQQYELVDIWAKVDANLSHPWSITELAGLMHLSEAQFNRVVHRQHHCTPGQVLTRMRIDRAKLLLRNQQVTLQAIAQEVGYANAYAFAKAFKRTVGNAPGQFRLQTHRLI
jgi:AraC-like DNA-binding protein/quercetin dioxygenase-like cupin family protein